MNSYNLNRVKRSMRDIDIEYGNSLEYLLSSKVYVPKQLSKEIPDERYKDLAKYINKNKELIKDLENSDKKLKEIITLDISKDIYNDLQAFELRKIQDAQNAINNPNKFVNIRSKINLNELHHAAINIPVEKRTLKTIRFEYSKRGNFKKVSLSSISKSISDKLHFNYKETEKKSSSFFKVNNVKAEILFIYRLIKDLAEGKNIVFYDEAGISKGILRKKCWKHSGEDKYSKKNFGFKRINLLMLTGKRRIEKYQLRKRATNSKVFNSFIVSFIKEKGFYYCSNTTIVLDNASFHLTKDALRSIPNSFNRLLFIPPNLPQYNQIEFMFGIVKKIFTLKLDENK